MSHAVRYRGAALADGLGPALRKPVTITVQDGRVTSLSDGDADDPAEHSAGRTTVVDASGATIVPGFVDCHSHLTLQGGAQWIARGSDPTPDLVEAAERNAAALIGAGVRWVRDVGSPRRADAGDGRERALALGLRDRWRGQDGYPYIRAAGTWLTKAGSLPAGLAIEVTDADALLAAALAQLADGADLVKLYLDGPDAGIAPWSADEVLAVVSAVHARGATVAAHGSGLANCRLAAESAVDTLEHGFALDDDIAKDHGRQRRDAGLDAVGHALLADLRLDDADRALLGRRRPVSHRRAARDGRAQHQDRPPGWGRDCRG